MIINAGPDDNGKARRLRLAPQDIEEAVARCGWTCLNDAKEISDEDRTELRRIRLQGFCAMTTEGPTEALAWWKVRLIT